MGVQRLCGRGGRIFLENFWGRRVKAHTRIRGAMLRGVGRSGNPPPGVSPYASSRITGQHRRPGPGPRVRVHSSQRPAMFDPKSLLFLYLFALAIVSRGLTLSYG